MKQQGPQYLKWLKGVGLVGVIVLIYFIFGHTSLGKELSDPQQLQALIQSAGVIAPLVIILLQILQNVISIIPSELVSIISGFAFGPLLGVVYSLIGAVIGSIIVFYLSRYFGKRLVAKLFHKHELVHFNLFFRQNPFWGVYLTRVAPIFPNELIGFAAGLTSVKFSKYLLASTLGFLTEMIILSYFGAQLSSGKFSWTLLIYGGVVFLMILAVAFKKQLKHYLIKDLHRLEREGKVIEKEIEKEFKKI